MQKAVAESFGGILNLLRAVKYCFGETGTQHFMPASLMSYVPGYRNYGLFNEAFALHDAV